jgi:1-deoxy-D-xylulose-5-phosphate synthase
MKNLIEDPKQLKQLNIAQSKELAKNIRLFLIGHVSKTGGHLSSNLGIVELTIALHKSFDSPTDKLIFDVGHQGYVHKILTGRASMFDTLRQFEGLSGFLKQSESKHDVWEAGHASTSLSAALGFAIKRDLDKKDNHVVAIIGDGSLTGGMVYEALNQIGALKKKIIVVFNDNDMSISKNVGAVSHSFSRMRASRPYTTLKSDMKGLLSTSKVGSGVLKGLSAVKDSVKDVVLKPSIFSELGLEYIGPIDGHDIKTLLKAFELAKEHDGPIVIHALTKKGKGFPYSEVDRKGIWHGVGQFDPETGFIESSGVVDSLSWSSVISETLVRLAKKDKDIVAITPAMITGSKLEKFFSLFPERSFDCGIAEEHAMTLASSLAVAGAKPFLSIYSTFLQRAYDQLNHDVARISAPVVLGIDRAGIVGEDGDTHHGVFDIGLINSLPNVVLAHPKDATEAQHLLYSAFAYPGPFALRYPRGSVHYHQVESFELIPIGTWTIEYLKENPKVIFIGYGEMVVHLSSRVAHNELDVMIVNARYLKPMDTSMLDALAKKDLPIVVYEPDMQSGGLYQHIMQYYHENKINVSLSRIGLKDTYIEHGSMASLKKACGIDSNSVMEYLNNIIDTKNNK